MSACEICVYAREHGSWPDLKFTHCRDCHRTWPMRATTPHCTVCHRHFGGQRGFDRHIRFSAAGPVCTDPASLSPPLTLDEGGVWRSERPAAFQNRREGLR